MEIWRSYVVCQFEMSYFEENLGRALHLEDKIVSFALYGWGAYNSMAEFLMNAKTLIPNSSFFNRSIESSREIHLSTSCLLNSRLDETQGKYFCLEMFSSKHEYFLNTPISSVLE